MALVNYSTSGLSGTLGTVNVVDALSQAFQDIGFTQIDAPDTAASGYESRILEIDFDPTKAKGKTFLSILVYNAGLGNSFTGRVLFNISDNWDTVNSSGTNFSTGSGTRQNGTSDNLALGTAPALTFNKFDHPELKMVVVNQSGLTPNGRFYIGVARPANKPDWWDEDTFNYAFSIAGNTDINGFYPLGAGSNPMGNANLLGFLSAGDRMLTGNANGGYRDLFSGIPILASSADGNGSLGTFSSDIVIGGNAGMSVGEKFIVTPGTEEYRVLCADSLGSLAVRSA